MAATETATEIQKGSTANLRVWPLRSMVMVAPSRRRPKLRGSRNAAAWIPGNAELLADIALSTPRWNGIKAVYG